MNHWRITINRVSGRATVERKGAYGDPEKWRFYGRVKSEAEAERLIRSGWPDEGGVPTTSLDDPFTLEVVR